MAAGKRKTDDRVAMSKAAFAALGGDQIAYIRKLNSEDVADIFPGAPEMAPGLKLWALLAADGTPIMLSDSREVALTNAMDAELTTLSVH